MVEAVSPRCSAISARPLPARTRSQVSRYVAPGGEAFLDAAAAADHETSIRSLSCMTRQPRSVSVSTGRLGWGISVRRQPSASSWSPSPSTAGRGTARSSP